MRPFTDTEPNASPELTLESFQMHSKGIDLDMALCARNPCSCSRPQSESRISLGTLLDVSVGSPCFHTSTPIRNMIVWIKSGHTLPSACCLEGSSPMLCFCYHTGVLQQVAQSFVTGCVGAEWGCPRGCDHLGGAPAEAACPAANRYRPLICR